MEFAEVIRRRRMVRQFADRPLTPEIVERILASALRAPSAKFAQGWSFLVLTESADLTRFWPFVPNQSRHTPELKNAPLVVVPMAHKAGYLERHAEAKWPAPYWYVDTGMATLMMLLSAVDEGLGAFLFWIMPEYREDRPDSEIPAHLERFRAEFGIPAEYEPLGAVAIGYRAENLAPQNPELAGRRIDAGTLMHHGKWGTPMPTAGADFGA